MRTIGEGARFFLTRHWVRTRIGPYVVTTTEVRPSAYETTVTWGEGGPQVGDFGSDLTFKPEQAKANHGAICARVKKSVGLLAPPADGAPAA